MRERELEAHALSEQLAERATALDAKQAETEASAAALLSDAEARLARVLEEETALVQAKVRTRQFAHFLGGARVWFFRCSTWLQEAVQTQAEELATRAAALDAAAAAAAERDADLSARADAAANAADALKQAQAEAKAERELLDSRDADVTRRLGEVTAAQAAAVAAR